MSQSKVIILMATYNGQKYLAEQLDSILAQTHENWEIWASDDGSSDDTIAILQAYQQRLGESRLRIVKGPRKGFAANFLSLVTNTSSEAAYYSFCDQDDEWEPTKIEKALEWLETIDANRPALYCSRTTLVDEQGKHLGFSPLFEKPPGFLNALVQSIAGANTMLFNSAAQQLLKQAGNESNIVSHDWWTYLLVTGAGGVVHYDPQSLINYRQHAANLVGGNSDWRARLQRIRLLFQGRLRQWNDLNTEALLRVSFLLTDKNRHVLEQFARARNSALLPRAIKTKALGVYRQTMFGNIGLAIATVCKKI